MNAESKGTSMESVVSVEKPKKAANWKNPFRRMLDNPVILKELRGRMRGKQAFILLTAYLGLIAVLIGVIYLSMAEQSSYGNWDPSRRQTMGKTIFGAVVLLELLLVTFIAPSLTTGAITGEREHQTFDLLRTTLLSARSLVLGKLGSACAYLFLLILTALPVESLAFLLGGVGIAEMVVSSLMLVVTAIFYCTLGIFFSSFMKRTLTATVSSYGAILASFVFIVVIFVMITFYVNTLPSVSNMDTVREYILTILVWFVVCTNPFLAAILSEVILVENQSLYYMKESIFGSTTFYLPSPWIPYTIIYLLLTGLLIILSIRRVRRPDR